MYIYQGLPGYYSSYYNETTGSTVPGTACIGCHDTEPSTESGCSLHWHSGALLNAVPFFGYLSFLL